MGLRSRGFGGKSVPGKLAVVKRQTAAHGQITERKPSVTHLRFSFLSHEGGGRSATSGGPVIHSRCVRGQMGASGKAGLFKQFDVFEGAYSLLISVNEAEYHVLAVRDFSLDYRNLTSYGPIGAL